jgi:hydroxyacylglutathione hydrolase
MCMPTTTRAALNWRAAPAPPTTCTRATAAGCSSTLPPLTDGQRLEAGNVVIDVLHTPGHTPDSVCLVVRDLRRGDEPWFVITGDTLFVGAVGRPDLAGHEHTMAAQLHDTLHSKLLCLPAELEVYPGHQAGSACGVGLSGKPASTLGFERRFNPMLAMDKPAFIEALTAEIPPPPADMARIVQANLRGGRPTDALA